MNASITATEFQALISSGKQIELIDVRTPVEFREIHVDLARNVPLDRLDPQAIQAARGCNANEPLYLVCRSGARGKQACEKFHALGFSNVVNIEGGTSACAAAGIPVTRGKKAVPLNCQVQIITGSLVILGSALAIGWNPLWIALPIFMGAGLTYSGVTNTCIMGTMLARMPWNQVAASTASSHPDNNPNNPSSQSRPSGVCCK